MSSPTAQSTAQTAKRLDLTALGDRLWKSADLLRANSALASNQYFFPVMGLIFLRHAYNRYLMVKEEVEKTLPSRGGVVRPLTKQDFQQRAALFLQEKAQFKHLADLPDNADLGAKLNEAMQSIEDDYPELARTLPKGYDTIDPEVLRQLLTYFNDEELRHASDDVFGRIYEYFLVGFANQAAHDSGEFFTPVSLVQMLVSVLEPASGRIYDPACGSGGMFVQSQRYLEEHDLPRDQLAFWGQEKNSDTIKLAKMNLAVHGMSGNISQAISYYNYDQQPLKVGGADFVMANPPFNVDEIDATKVKSDPRLPFGLPGVNKDKKVPNGNYIWVSYFYSYLNATGRAGFVMSSQTSSAGRDEAKVREQLVKTGHVDIMMAISGGFFYTRTVPCELWFLDKGKPAERLDTVLMLDARHTRRKVSRTVYDFSPEQLHNLTSIVWLYRGQQQRFLDLVAGYLTRTAQELRALQGPLGAFITKQAQVVNLLTQGNGSLFAQADAYPELDAAQAAFNALLETYSTQLDHLPTDPPSAQNQALHDAREALQPAIHTIKALGQQVDALQKHLQQVIDEADQQAKEQKDKTWKGSAIRKEKKELDELAAQLKEALDQPVYFEGQAAWLQHRFPDAELVDVPGLVKVVNRETIEAADYSLTPGRYVGVSPDEDEEGFDFTATMRGIHSELAELNTQAEALARQIQVNLEELAR